MEVWHYSDLPKNGILSPKLFWPIVRKNCSSDREKLLKFEAEGWEFKKILRSQEQFIQTVKERSEQFLLTECFFNLFLEVSKIWQIRTIRIQIGKKYWDLGFTQGLRVILSEKISNCLKIQTSAKN